MSNKLVCLLVILFTAGQAPVQAGKVFTVLDTMMSWGSTLYSLYDMATDNTGESIDKILSKVNEMSSQLDSISIQTPTKLDTILNTLLTDIEVTTELQHQTTQLLDRLHRINHYHEDSSKYRIGKSYANQTLKEFTNRVLYNANNLPKTLVDIHDIFNPGPLTFLRPGFLQIIARKARQILSTDCQRHISPQQSIFYLYVQLLLAEAKGLATMKSVYTIMWYLENSAYNYRAELTDVKNSFDSSVREYRQIFADHIALYPQHLHRCHINTPRSADYFQLQNYTRISFFQSEYIGMSQCSNPPKMPHNIFGDPQESLYDCTRIGNIVTKCPAESGSSRNLVWFENDERTRYGRSGTCPRATEGVVGFKRPQHFASFFHRKKRRCPVYACTSSILLPKRPDEWFISTSSQISDITHNKVVTGVRFIVEDRTIFLQIQQAKFSKSGMVYNDVAWKNLNKSEEYQFGYHYRTIYLDDATVPDGYAVTGVAWVRTEGVFQLGLHATLIDFNTGELNPRVTRWCYTPGCGDKAWEGDYGRAYTRERTEINLSGVDDPLQGAEFNYDLEANKMIKLTRTDLTKDAGQTIIPFFDAQPVQAEPLFPLSGVRVVYRARSGFGGYIVPQIKTFDLTKELQKPPST